MSLAVPFNHLLTQSSFKLQDTVKLGKDQEAVSLRDIVGRSQCQQTIDIETLTATKIKESTVLFLQYQRLSLHSI